MLALQLEWMQIKMSFIFTCTFTWPLNSNFPKSRQWVNLQAMVSGRKMYFWPRAHPLNLWLPPQPNQPPALNCYSLFLASCPPSYRGLLPLHLTLHSFNSVYVVNALIHQPAYITWVPFMKQGGFQAWNKQRQRMWFQPLEATDPPSLGLWTFWGQETMALMFILYFQCSALGPYKVTQYIFVGCMEGYLYAMMSR